MRTAILAALLLGPLPALAGEMNPAWNPYWQPYEVCREAEGEVVSESAPDAARAAALNMCMTAIKSGGTNKACETESAKLPAMYRKLGDYLCKSAVIIGTER